MDNWSSWFCCPIFYFIHRKSPATRFWLSYIRSNRILKFVLHKIPCRLTCYSYKFLLEVVCWKQADTNTWLRRQVMVQCYIQWNAILFRSKYFVWTITIIPNQRLLVIWCILRQYICQEYHARKAIWKNHPILSLFR